MLYILASSLTLMKKPEYGTIDEDNFQELIGYRILHPQPLIEHFTSKDRSLKELI